MNTNDKFGSGAYKRSEAKEAKRRHEIEYGNFRLDFMSFVLNQS